ncbi:chemotaxis-specific protein-glutamate methyltransferase CheB [Sphingorhabdus sp.]|jgi:two-component system chemotaxis response regulator CheB|uniref:chemotaxis-specific protein-glutamate methyltransferase CheB n=2 Tax=Sphingorhabdus sp. TaxID=1902408 RepID=UPI003BAEF13B|nr:chemotaxis-specific protein-glutamate methyltransferase CheB [Sphingomonadales bacterium]MBK9431614.1 chemotaxis-specific protein-glutamate methyltransferase CheB [Sphingomonadales bacterium]MBL0021818.1 chemotaxis-specific protein-glutamate methyltransferase CheB [Sphingomonadales bacterium]
MLAHLQPRLVKSKAPYNPLRVLIVDDSVVARSVFSRVLNACTEIEVAASAANCAEALEFLTANEVDIILLDIEMPDRSGIDALPEIVALAGDARVIIVSAFIKANGPAAIQALSLGACDTLAKPGSVGSTGRFSELLVHKVLRLGRPVSQSKSARPKIVAADWQLASKPECIAIGASTGGIPICYQLVSSLPQQLTCPVFITQHLPAVFMDFFARQLSALTSRSVSVATRGAVVRPNEIILAPGDAHLVCRKSQGRTFIDLVEDSEISRYCPSVDILFGSVAKVFGDRALGIVLSGMGNDGCDGARKIREQGGAIIVQDEKSSVVWGMPGAVARQNSADAILSPDDIAEQLRRVVLL